MAILPATPQTDLVAAIDAAFLKAASEPPRAHLGASLIGEECERKLWYSFRWAITEERFDGRMLRLFERGKREEAVFAELLWLAGCNVQMHDANGRQFQFTEPSTGGHFAGSLDGIVTGIPEAPKTAHVCEFKTHSNKSFNDLLKQGVRVSKPNHFAQMQTYMRWAGLERALYLAVNKDTDELYAERVYFEKDTAEALANKALRIIEAQEPPAKMTEDPAFWKCRFCEFRDICHGTASSAAASGLAMPAVTCRTCLHSTPLTGDAHAGGQWHCAKWNAVIPLEESRKAMPCHRYIPKLVTFAEAVDSTEAGDVLYVTGDGVQFANGEFTGQHCACYLSEELRSIAPEHIGDPVIESLKKTSAPASLPDTPPSTLPADGNAPSGSNPRVLNKYVDDYSSAVFIGRPSKWGNPFVIGQHGSREEVIEKYRQWILSNTELLEDAKKELAGRDLACFCKPAACHGDVLLEIANHAAPPNTDLFAAHAVSDAEFAGWETDQWEDDIPF